MARADLISTNFTSGEVSKLLIGRTDIAKYPNGVDTLENFLIMLQGGITRRPGLRYIAGTDGICRLMPFQYSADLDYVIAATDQKFKLYTNSATAVIDTQADIYTKLLLHANGVNGSKEIQDSGNTGYIVTQVGTATLSLAQKKFGLCSLLLDGDSDYLTVPDSDDWTFGNGKFTIDTWVRFNSVAADQTICEQQEDPTNYWGVGYLQATKKLIVAFVNAGGYTQGINVSIPWTPVADTWYHIAIVRDGNTSATWHIFIDGVEGTKTLSAGDYNKTFINHSAVLKIGGYSYVGYFNGYIDEFRISKGVARWTADFTPSTTPYTSDANTQLLLHMESLDVSSATTPKIPTFVGTAQLSTAQYKDLTGYTTTRASLLLDGNSDYLTVPDSADWDITTEAYSIESFIRFVALPSAGVKQVIASQYASATSYWELSILNTAGTYSIQFLYYSGAAKTVTVNSTGLAINTWYYIAMCKSGNDYYFFQDGVLQGTMQTSAFSVLAVAGGVQIGAVNGASWFNGYLDEVRLSKGITKWTTNFTPTTAEYALDPLIVTEISTPYLEDSLFQIQHAHKGDIKYLTHVDYHPRVLSRTSPTAFSLGLVPFVRGPFLDTNTTAALTITPSADTGDARTLTSAAPGAFHYDADDGATTAQLQVGSLWRIKSGVVKITAVNSATVAIGNVQAEPDGSAGNLATGPGATADWAEGAFSGYRGYPVVCGFHDGRLWYACTEHEPQKGWGSCVYEYDNFYVGSTPADDEAVTFEIATEERISIRWLASGNKALSIGSSGGTFSAYGSSNGPITPTDIQVNRDTNYGSALLPAKKISSFLYYVQRNLRKIRELSYYYDYDVTRASDMTLLAEHILRDGSGVVDWDYQQSPNDRLWCVRNDGQIAVITRNPEQEVMGWSRIIAGTDSTMEGKFESICVIPKQNNDDQVWVVVKRRIDGTEKRFIEFFMTEQFDETWDAICLDSSLTLDKPSLITGVTIASDLILYSAGDVALSNGNQIKINGVVGTTEINGIFKVANLTIGVSFTLTDLDDVAIDFATYGAWISGGEIRKMVDSVSGLNHLEGETVQVQMDGDVPATNSFVVTGYSINLPEKAAVVHVGLPYTPYMKTLRPEGGSQLGTSQGKIKRIPKITARFYRTLACQIGSEDKQDRVNFDNLYTGDRDIPVPIGWERESQIIVKSDKPLPLTLIALMPQINTSDM